MKLDGEPPTGAKGLDTGLVPCQLDGTLGHGELIVMELEPRALGNLLSRRADIRPSVLRSGRMADLPAEGSGHRLGPEADSKHGNAGSKAAADEFELGAEPSLDPIFVDRPGGPHQHYEIVWVVGKGGGHGRVTNVLHHDEGNESGAALLQMGPHPLRCGQGIMFDHECSHGPAG